MTKQPANPKIAAHLLVDFDFFAVGAIDGDLHQGWKSLHAGHRDLLHTAQWRPLGLHPRSGHWRGGGWINDRFSNKGVTMSREEREMQYYPGEADPPQHGPYRALLPPFFSQKAVPHPGRQDAHPDPQPHR